MTYRYHGPGRRRGTKRSGRRSRERWGGTPDRQQLGRQGEQLGQKYLMGVIELTQTKDNHVCADDDGAHGGREELADTTQHHDHTHRDVNEPARHIG